MTQVLFVCDSGPEVGGGHVMRSLTLAGALAAEGAGCTFLAPPAVDALLDAYDITGCGRVRTDAPNTTEALARAASAALRETAFDAAVLDHFGWGQADDGPLRAHGRVLLAIDDLADRPRDVDLLLDVSFGRTREAYAGLLPGDTELLLGPRYALLRPEFAAARATGRRVADQPVRRVLVSLGLTDVGGITDRVLALLAPVSDDLEIDVVTGAGAPSLARLRARAARDPRVRLHVDTTAMADLMAEADLAVGAGGSSTWERACLGLPTLTLVLAENQAELARTMAADGLTVAVDARDPAFETALPGEFARLVADAGLRASMSERVGALCDGLGASRVARRLTQRLAASPAG